MGVVAPWHVVSSWTRDQTWVPCIGRRILNPLDHQGSLLGDVDCRADMASVIKLKGSLGPPGEEQTSGDQEWRQDDQYGS